MYIVMIIHSRLLILQSRMTVICSVAASHKSDIQQPFRLKSQTPRNIFVGALTLAWESKLGVIPYNLHMYTNL